MLLHLIHNLDLRGAHVTARHLANNVALLYEKNLVVLEQDTRKNVAHAKADKNVESLCSYPIYHGLAEDSLATSRTSNNSLFLDNLYYKSCFDGVHGQGEKVRIAFWAVCYQVLLV